MVSGAVLNALHTFPQWKVFIAILWSGYHRRVHGSAVILRAGSGGRLPAWVKCCPHCSVGIWPWVSYISLILSFLSCKMERIILCIS